MTARTHKSKFRMKIAISIRAKLLLLAGVLLSALIGSSLFLRAELADGSDAIKAQGEVLVTLNTTTAALREFGPGRCLGCCLARRAAWGVQLIRRRRSTRQSGQLPGIRMSHRQGSPVRATQPDDPKSVMTLFPF